MKNNKVLKAGIWYTISNFLIKGITFITMPIFTRLMTTNDIGSFSNISSWFAILSIITTFELYSSVSIARFDYKDDLDSYISSNLFLGTFITIIFYIIVIIFSDFFQGFFSMDMSTIHLIFIYLLVYPSIQMFQVKRRFTYKYKSIVIVSIISSILSSCISLICVLCCSNALSGRIYGFYIPLIIISIIIYMMLMIKGKSISPKYWKYSLSISIPLIFHLLAGNLLSSSDRIMISKIINTDATALYTVAYSCSMIISILWSSMNIAWSPWALEMLDKKNYEILRCKSKPYFIFFAFIVSFFMLFAPEILYIMGGENYMQAIYVIPPVMVGFIFQFIYSLYVNIESYNKKQKSMALGTIIAAIINIILNFIFIPLFGYVAAAYTTLIGYISLYFIHYLLVKKIGFCNCYDNSFFRKGLVLFTISIPILNILYQFNLIRYFLLFMMLVFIIYIFLKNKKIIFESIKKHDYMALLLIFKSKRITDK